MKFLYHHRTRSRDGQSIHIDEMIKALEALGARVIIVGSERVAAMKPARRKAILPQFLYELLEFGYNFVELAKLARAILRDRPDAIYQRANIYMLSSLWASRLFGLPLILEVNAPLTAERGKFNGLAFPAFARWTEESLWRGASLVMPVTNVLADIIRQAGVPSERILVTSNGIDPAQFHDAVAPAPHDLKTGVVLGFVGYIRSWHGLPQVVSLLASDPALKDAGLIVVGDGPARAELEDKARELGVADRVRVTGVVDHHLLPSHIASFDIALQPEVTAYASPLKLFEYMAMGKAVIAPDTENIREILSDGGNALLVKPDDSQSLSQAVRRLTSDGALRRAIGAAAAAAVRDRDLTWSRNAQRAIAAARRLRRNGAP